MRIGIHTGDVVFENGDIFGDGVNISSRIEPLAKPGGIALTETVYEALRNKPEFNVQFIGHKTLKNVDHPIGVYALHLEAPSTLSAETKSSNAQRVRKQLFLKRRSVWIPAVSVLVIAAILIPIILILKSSESVPDTELAEINSIAVLPFENYSGDETQEYFVDAMTDLLISELHKIGSLKVISRTSVMQFKGINKPITEISDELGVDAIVEGSVLREGDKIRFTVQLINGPRDEHMWAENYDREVKDVFIATERCS